MKGGGEGGDETFFWYEDMSLCERLRAAKTAYFLDLRQRLNESELVLRWMDVRKIWARRLFAHQASFSFLAAARPRFQFHPVMVGGATGAGGIT